MIDDQRTVYFGDYILCKVSVHKADVHRYLLDDILWPTQHGTPHEYSKLWKGVDSTLKYSSNKCHQNV
jgi:hypothetical protein